MGVCPKIIKKRNQIRETGFLRIWREGKDRTEFHFLSFVFHYSLRYRFVIDVYIVQSLYTNRSVKNNTGEKFLEL